MGLQMVDFFMRTAAPPLCTPENVIHHLDSYVRTHVYIPPITRQRYFSVPTLIHAVRICLAMAHLPHIQFLVPKLLWSMCVSWVPLFNVTRYRFFLTRSYRFVFVPFRYVHHMYPCAGIHNGELAALLTASLYLAFLTGSFTL